MTQNLPMTYGPDVYCPLTEDYAGTERAGTSGPFRCMDCGSPDHEES